MSYKNHYQVALLLMLLVTTLMLPPLHGIQAAFSGIILSTTPAIPKPSQETVVHAALPGVSKESVLVWVVDGVEMLRGAGLQDLSLVAPRVGESTTITVSALSGGSPVASQSLTVQPADVLLEWEGNGDTVPFNIGRPQFTAHGLVAVTAVTDFITAGGSQIPPASIRFVWSVNGVEKQKESGYGRSTLTVAPPFFDNTFDVAVTATSRDGTLHAYEKILITPKSADMVVYETSPLSGVKDLRAIQGPYAFTTEEISFIAYPLYTPPTPTYPISWLLDGEPVSIETGDPRLVVFRKTGTGVGSFTVSAEYKSINGFLDSVSKSLILKF